MNTARHLERPTSLLLIFGAFFAVTLPLILLRTVPNFFPGTEVLVLAQAWGLGTTHFLITGVLYLRLANRQWFVSSTLRRLVFVAGPIAIFVAYGALAAGRFEERAPAVAAAVFAALRVFDFTHVGRQSFGILQLLNAGSAPRPRLWRRLENGFFLLMAGLQLLTVLGDGRFDPGSRLAVTAAAVACALFVLLAGGYGWRILREGPQRGTLAPAGYLLLQSTSAALAVWRTELYTIALSMHYVEYHVMMAPRCFAAPVDDQAKSDRLLGWLGDHRLLFASGLLALAFLFGATRHLGADGSVPVRFFIHVFDGLFLTHFLVEALLWRFHEPYLRQSIAPLYLQAKPVGPWPGSASWLRGAAGALAAAALCVALLHIPAVEAHVTPLWSSLRAETMDPGRASFHMNFAIELALEERYDEALAHAEISRAARPDDESIRDVTEMIRRLRSRAADADARGP